jgi:FkbM family methyltransferase
MIKLARALLNRAGFDLIRTKHQHGSLDAHLRNLFDAKAIDCVLDVGANSGQYGTFLRQLGFDGYIVSFEPVRSVFSKLEHTAARDRKWLCYNLALGDDAGEKEINVYSSTVFSSFLSANDYSKGIWKSLNSVAPELVSVVRLDDIFAEIEQRTACTSVYLKMDTQGFDRNVFNGALNSLGKVLAMQSELSLLSVYEGMPFAYDVLNEYHARDYYISGLYPINRDDSLAVIEYDCVLVRKN